MRRALFLSWVPALLAAGLAGGCSRKTPRGSSALFPIIVQLDWVAEPEHGAFYEAQALGYFRDEGLNVRLVQGGANAYVIPRVGTDQAQLGQADSTTALVAIQNGTPIVNVASIFQHDPSVLMMQESNPVRTWKDLNGRTIMARPDWAFLKFLRNKYHINFRVIPQNFGLGRLASDPNFIQQGYYIAEPYRLAQRGIKLKFLYAWDTGFDSYTTLIANRTFAREHGPELRAFLRALRRGYRQYIEGDPAPAHRIMLRINPQATPDYLAWSRRQIIKAGLARPPGGDYLDISPARYQAEIDQLENLGVLRKGAVTVAEAMDGSYLPPESRRSGDSIVSRRSAKTGRGAARK
ncbi:MAG: ABC transporter substrate-binding protein [Opitutaceae bacterium]